MAYPSPTLVRSGFSWRDALFVVFMHKWKIVIFSLIGILAALAVYWFDKPVFESEAKLMVRYVVDRSVVDPAESSAGNLSRYTENIINSEVEILSSWDLAKLVAIDIGPDRLLEGRQLSRDDKERLSRAGKTAKTGETEEGEEFRPETKTDAYVGIAAEIIQKGLTIIPRRGSNVIFVSYRSHDADLTYRVMQKLVQSYLIRHREIRNSIESITLVEGQAGKIEQELKSADEKLDRGKTKAELDLALLEAKQQLQAANVERAEQEARVNEIKRLLPPESSAAIDKATSGRSPTAGTASPASRTASPALAPATGQPVAPPSVTIEAGGVAANSVGPEPPNPIASTEAAKPDPAPPAIVDQYYRVMRQLYKLRDDDMALLAKYKPGHSQVKTNRANIARLERERMDLEAKHPDLTDRAPAAISGNLPATSLTAELARLKGLDARIDIIKDQIDGFENELKALRLTGADIAKTERDRAINEENYKYLSASVAKARIDEHLGKAAGTPNIKEVQKPTGAMRVTSGRNKLMGGFAAGGIVAGILLAYLIEMVFHRTVKRPLELESRLQAPVLLSIPFISKNGQKRLRSGSRHSKNGNGDAIIPPNNGSSVSPWEVSHFIRPFAEVLRDRLTLYFDVNGLTHKPKLVGVTGASSGAGASTVAGGLAAALSETGDGKVLLVDMNIGGGDVHPFFKGKPAYGLTEAIESSENIDSAADNLYLASVTHPSSTPVPMGLKRFHHLMPGFKSSDYDYIIFDMPPLSQTSPTLGMTTFMDKVMLVVEAEKSDRDLLNRRYSELASGQAKISVLFNKARQRGPRWLGGEV